ncbi:ras GEF [Lichtheimia hyalospora FSU 10163]|nr:ras GEF [Lichtheimia hyalospora FSU 10163]
MQHVESSLLSATRLEEEGKVKDAYMSFMDITQQALQGLYDIKFIHSSIVSQPKQYTALISAVHTCLTHIEHIIDTHSPSKNQIPEPIVPKSPRPPLPPKPSRIQKPVIPPKPIRPAPSSPIKDLDQPPVPKPRIPQRPLPDDIRPVSAPQSPANDTNIDHYRRPRSETPHDMVTKVMHNRAVAEGKVDPTHLVPAQTNAGDSLSPPSSTSLNTDHLPIIPAPPLLTTHRILQARLDELESTIKDCRQRKQQTSGSNAAELDNTILQYTGAAADVKHTLNRVRTLYMSAATIPTILQFPAHMIAYQVTLIESAIFNAIPPKALLEHSAKHPHPRIVASTDFFNYLTRVIEHTILLPQEASSRAQHINHWIKVASKCLDLNNYQTLKAIVSALGTPPVQRLRRTWAYIPKKSMTKLEGLNELMSESDNYGKYREHMGMVNASVIQGRSAANIRAEHYTKPTVPFLGTFIHDMTYMLAAANNNKTAAMDDPRVAAVLDIISSFQKGPAYTAVPPNWFVKAAQKHHHLRPAALSSALLHRSASGIGRFSGGMFGGNNNNNDDDAANKENMIEEDSLEEQQQTITQYLLMRSWVNQNTIDELSVLREPPRQQQQPGSSSYRSTTGSNHHTSSVISNTSSLMRFSTGSISQSTLTGGSRATSMEDCSPDASDDPDTIKVWHRHSHDDDHSVNKAPHIPPRPPPRKEEQDKDFKVALAQRIQAQVDARHPPPHP